VLVAKCVISISLAVIKLRLVRESLNGDATEIARPTSCSAPAFVTYLHQEVTAFLPSQMKS